MLIRTLVALTLVAPIAAHAVPIPAERPVTCPGPSLEQVVTDVGPADAFVFSGDSLRPFFGLWVQGRNGPMGVTPDAVTVLAREHDRPAVLVYSLGGCAVAVLEVTRTELYDAMRAGIGPVV